MQDKELKLSEMTKVKNICEVCHSCLYLNSDDNCKYCPECDFKHLVNESTDNIPEWGMHKGKRLDNGEEILGHYIPMKHTDDRTHIHHFIIPLDSDMSYGTLLENIMVEIDPATLERVAVKVKNITGDDSYKMGNCPKCNERVGATMTDIRANKANYCSKCGVRWDWR